MKLAKDDLDEQQVAATSREQLLDAWAKVVVTDFPVSCSNLALRCGRSAHTVVISNL
jgi:hypothetical protein